MALQYKLENLDGVDEATKGLYIKVGEGYQLEVDGVEDVTELKNTAAARKKERDALSLKLKEAEAAQKALDDEKVAAEAKRLEEKGEYKTLAEKSAARELETATELADLKAKLADKARTETAGTVVADITKGVDVARAELMKEQALKFIQTDDAGNTVIAGPDGIADATKLAEHLKTAFPFLAGASPAGGGGGNGGQQGAPSGEYINDYAEKELTALRQNNKPVYDAVLKKGYRR